jgi:hypothetical protein
MADIDLFGYSRAEAGHYLYSSDYAAVYFANTPGGAVSPAGKAALVQSAGVSYQHNVQPRFESGSHELYWVTGQSLGTLQMARLIGDRGFLDGINYGRAANDLRKGVLGGVEFKVGQESMVGVSVKQDVLVLSGCVLSAWGTSFNVGGLEVQEALTIQTALVKRGFRA